MKRTILPILTAALLAGASQSQALILISEINSNGTGGDFFEIYNAGSSAVDLGGWKWVDNASGSNGGPSFNGARAYAFNAFTLNAGSSALVVSDASGNATGNTSFANSWGGLSGANLLTFNTGSGTGNGLGTSDLVALFNSAGTFVTGLNYGTSAVTITQGDTSTVSLLPFLRSGGGNSLGGHAGSAGGGAATVSLVWDPTSGTANPTYQNAVVGQWGAFANPNSSVTIGSPGVAVPEPSSTALLGLGTIALLGLRRLNRKA
jgi:hypothetical protein